MGTFFCSCCNSLEAPSECLFVKAELVRGRAGCSSLHPFSCTWDQQERSPTAKPAPMPHPTVSCCLLALVAWWGAWNQNTWQHYLKDASCALIWEDSLPVCFQTFLLNAVFLEMWKYTGILSRCLGTDSEMMGREGPLECWSAVFCYHRHLLINPKTSIYKTS